MKKQEKCPHCGSWIPRSELVLIAPGKVWDTVLCPQCKKQFGIVVDTKEMNNFFGRAVH